jgi:chaperonin GroEL
VRAAQLIAGVSRPLENSDVTRLATSSSGSAEIGGVVGKVMAATGRSAALLVEPTRRFGLDHEITRGLRFDHGYASPQSITDRTRREAVLELPKVLLHRGRLASVPRVDSGNLLVVCEEITDVVLATLMAMSAVVVIASADVLARLAPVVGGGVLDADMMLVDVAPENMGRAAKVVVTEHDTTVIGLPDVRAPEAGPAAAGVILAPAAAGIIRAPAADVERVRGAVRTVRGAVTAGVLRGAAMGLREVGERLAAEATGSPAEVAGWKALAGALSEPSRWIAENAAVEVSDLDPALIDSAATARAVVAAATATAARFLLVA